MRPLYFLWFSFLIGTFFIMFKLMKIEDDISKNTSPKFNYIEFEIPPTPEYSKTLFDSIHKNGMKDKVQESLDVDFWYIFFYVGATILGWFLLLKKFKVNRSWIFILIGILGITAGVCDFIENGNLENLLTNWEIKAVENAAFFAKIKFAIILPLIGSLILGWMFFGLKKLRASQRK